MSCYSALPRTSPEYLGIPSSSIMDFVEDVEKSGLELHSFMLLRHGHVGAEGWWSPYGPERPHMLFSLSKSFTSTAVGLAVSEGLLTVDDPVLSFFPDDAPKEARENLASMCVRHLLTMSVGHAADTTGLLRESGNNNWVKAFLNLPVENVPGTQFLYNSGASYMLSAIVQKVTGKTLLEYLTPRLFEPLGIEGATWETCPMGINTGGWGLNIKTEDIAKFGQLYLQKGMWNGRQIIPSEWVEEATSYHISNSNTGVKDWGQGYCYQFWRCRHDAYRGDGAFGQFCIVMPKQDAVVAITSGLGDMQAVLDFVWKHLLPAMKDERLPLDIEEQEALKRKLTSLALVPPAIKAASPYAEIISSSCYEMEDNVLHIKTAAFELKNDICSLKIQDTHGGEHEIKFGKEKWHEMECDLFGEYVVAASSFTWSDDNNLVLTVRLVETPFYHTITCRFEGDTLYMELSTNVSFGPNERMMIKGHLYKSH